MVMARRIEAAVVAALVVVSASAAFLLPETGPLGLAGRYRTDRQSGPVTEATGVLPSTRDVQLAARSLGTASLEAEWRGFLHVDVPGPYAFLPRSSGAAAVFVSEQFVSRTGGEAATVDLSAGSHFIRVVHSRPEPPHEMAVLWGPAGARLGTLDLEHTSPPEGGRVPHARTWRRVAVLVPCIWAVLLIYVPTRVLGTLMWRDVRRLEPDRPPRLALVVVLVLATGLALWGIEWSLGLDDWAADELRPTYVRDALAQRFMGGWHDKYPALHYMTMGLPLVAFETAERLPRLVADPLWSLAAQHLVIRLVSTVMGLGALIAAYLCAVELYGRRRAVLAPLVLAMTPLYVFYAKLANLDVPMLCWFGWALLGFIRIVKGGGTQDFVLLGVAAAAAVATKDQAYASLALLVPAVLWVVWRGHAASARGRVTSTLADRRIWIGLLWTIGASLLFHNIVLNPSGFRDHLRVLSGFSDIAIVPRNVAGAWELTWRTVDLMRFSLGWPMFAVALVGLAQACRRPDRRWWLILLLVPLSFHLTFTWITFFVCDRYLFTGVFVLALFAGSALGDIWGGTGRRWARVSAAATLLVTLPYAASINPMMNADARKTARAAVVDATTSDETVGLVGRYVPVIPLPLRTSVIDTRDDLAGAAPDYVIVNARFAARFEQARRPAGRELMRALRDGSAGYDLALTYRAPAPVWAWLKHEPSFSREGEAWWTNLDKVNPEVEVYRRRSIRTGSCGDTRRTPASVAPPTDSSGRPDARTRGREPGTHASRASDLSAPSRVLWCEDPRSGAVPSDRRPGPP